MSVSVARLSEKWGSKEIWLRTLYVRCALLWLFRDEFTDLDLGALKSLASILADAYLIAVAEAARPCSWQQAFVRSIELVRAQINNRIAAMGDDVELQRLLKLVEEAQACDPLQEIFNQLARRTKNAYRTSPKRAVVLDRDWLISHPVGETRPGQYRDAYHVSAQTVIDGSKAKVELQIHLDRFDVFSLLAVPALLTHELICHAHAREDRNNDRSLWAEGVMDWVAMYFFDAWAGQVGLPYGLTRLHGRQLWDERSGGPWKYTGRLAADALVEWLTIDRSVRRTATAQVLACKFALQMNVVEAPLPTKDVLASRLLNIKRDQSLQRSIRDWHHSDAPVAALLS
jgi:hypothetical protein